MHPDQRHTLIWLRPARSRRELHSPRPELDQNAITHAAIELADAEGLEAVSMRRIAARLGAGATSLYWYVASKDDLYELMFDAVIGEIVLAESTGDWRSDLGALARASYAVLRRHPWTMMLGVQPGLGPKTRAWTRSALQLFAGQDVDLSTQINILAALTNYLFGFIHRQLAWAQLEQRSGLATSEWADRLRGHAEQASHADPDVGEEVAVCLELHTDRAFDFGLECVLDGVAARLRLNERPG